MIDKKINPNSILPKVTPVNFNTHVPVRLSSLAGKYGLLVSRENQTQFGIGLREWRIISILARFQPMTAIEISKRLGTARSNVSRAVNTLISKKLVGQNSDEIDKRRHILTLSESGIEIHDKIAPVSIDRAEHFLSIISKKESNDLRKILDKLHLRIDEMLDPD